MGLWKYMVLRQSRHSDYYDLEEKKNLKVSYLICKRFFLLVIYTPVNCFNLLIRWIMQSRRAIDQTLTKVCPERFSKENFKSPNSLNRGSQLLTSYMRRKKSTDWKLKSLLPKKHLEVVFIPPIWIMINSFRSLFGFKKVWRIKGKIIAFLEYE